MRCPQLRVLDVSSCPLVTDESLTVVARECRELRELIVSLEQELTERSISLLHPECQVSIY